MMLEKLGLLWEIGHCKGCTQLMIIKSPFLSNKEQFSAKDLVAMATTLPGIDIAHTQGESPSDSLNFTLLFCVHLQKHSR